MRVHVDPKKCQGHTLCKRVAPRVFRLREEDGHSYVEDPEVPPELEADVRKTVRGCPEGAISVDEKGERRP